MNKNMWRKLTTEDANAVIAASVRDLGYSGVKEKQMLLIVNFLIGNVFVALLTGYVFSRNQTLFAEVRLLDTTGYG